MPLYPSPPYSELPSCPPQGDMHPNDAAIKSLLASTWQMLQQPPPPSIREVLSAYNTKGTGDREMLLAMLNAKSAEDNRIAALATLQNSMLAVYTAASNAGMPPPKAEYPPPPHCERSAFSSRLPPSPPSGHASPPGHGNVRLPPVSSIERSRKRSRPSDSPSALTRPYSTKPHRPPNHSRFSSSSSQSESPSFSPRSAMAIGSLLSQQAFPPSVLHDAAWPARTSAERSTGDPSERQPAAS